MTPVSRGQLTKSLAVDPPAPVMTSTGTSAWTAPAPHSPRYRGRALDRAAQEQEK